MGKIPGGGGTNKTVQTNDYGEFQFTNLKAGNYKIIMEQTSVVNDETVIWVGDDQAADNIVTSESGLTSGKGDLKDNNNSNNNPTLKAQNNNTVRSNRTDNAIIMNNDNSNNQNNIAIDEGGVSKPKGKSSTKDVGPVKWMAPEAMKRNINTSEDNLKNMIASLDALEQQLDADQNNAKSIINTSRSNIKSQRIAIGDLEQTLENLQMMDKDAAMKELEQKRNETDLQFLKLQDSLHKLGAQYSTISNVLKSRHDIAMNAIRNMK